MALNSLKTRFLVRKCFKLYTKKGFLEKMELRFVGFALLLRKKKKNCFLGAFLSSISLASTVLQLKSVKLRGSLIRVPFYIKKSKKQFGIAGLKMVHHNLDEFYRNLFDLKISGANIKEHKRKLLYEIASQNKGFATYRWS